MNKSYILYCARCFFLFMIVGQSAIAVAAPKECDKPLMLSTTSNWPPYIYKDTDQQYKGIDLELLESILAELGCELVITQYPERRSLYEISQGRFDIGLGASKNKQRLKLHRYSTLYRQEVNRFAYRINDNDIAKAKSLQDILLLEKIIAINLAGWYGDAIEKAIAGHNNFIFSDNISKRLKMLNHHRVDIVVDDEMVLCHELVNSSYQYMTIHPLVLSENPIHFIFNKQKISKAFVTQFNTILEQMRSNGSLAYHFTKKLANICNND